MEGLVIARSTNRVAHNFTSSVVARRFLRFDRSSSLTLLIEGTPTTQEVKTTSGFGHDGYFQEAVVGGVSKALKKDFPIFPEMQ